MNARRRTLASGLLALLTLLLVLLALYHPQQPATSAEVVARAWELAQDSGSYRYRSQIEQRTYPQASLANAGSTTRQERYALEGSVDQRHNALELMLWQGTRGTPEQATGIRVEDGRTYQREGLASWREMDGGGPETFAPGGDPLAFLRGLRDIRSAGTESLQLEAQTGAAQEISLSYTRYTFTLDGPTLAEALRAQLEAQLRAGGKLPAGVSVDAAAGYRDLQGHGELWLDAEGLPRRMRLTLDLPPQRGGGRTSATVDSEYFAFDRQTLALASTGFAESPGAWLSYRLALHGPALGELAQRALLALACAALLAFAVRRWRDRRVYAATVIAVVLSLLVTPLAQAADLRDFAAEQQARQATQESAAEQQENLAAAKRALATSNWDPHRDPLGGDEQVATSVGAVRQPPLPQTDVAFANPPAAIQASGVITSTDTDGDGLSDADEASFKSCAYAGAAYCAGVSNPKDSDADSLTDGAEVHELDTLPTNTDTDTDNVRDSLEVRGFVYQGKTWYLDPNEKDTNRDGLIDGNECPSLRGVASASASATCPDTDGDGLPNPFDEDDDGDGVRDLTDISPLTHGGRVYDADNPLALSISNLTLNKPVLVDLQLRPSDLGHLQYLGNVLDWPSGDTVGQIQRRLSTTFATTANADARSSDIRAANGDIRLVPMLEVQIPYTSNHFGNLPVKSSYSGTRTKTTSPADWLDTSKTEPYGLSVSLSDSSSGTMSVLVPLSTVKDEAGADVAFSTQLLYWPSVGAGGRATWGAAHQLRVVWLVQMLTDECVNASADTDTCARQDTIAVIHTYEEAWTLTGMQVSEEHGLDVGIMYERPATDDNLKTDDDLWLTSWNLSNTFLTGRDCDSKVNNVCQSNGKRDVTIKTLQAQINSWSANDNNIGVWTNAQTYPHSGHIATVMMTETKTLLSQVFGAYASRTTPTLLFAQENTQRQLTLDYATLSGAAVSLDLNPATVLSNTKALLSWAPYTYLGSSWQNADVEDYTTTLETALKAVDFFKAADSTQASTDTAQGKRIWAQLYYIALVKGSASVVAAGGSPTWSQTAESYYAYSPTWDTNPSFKGLSYVGVLYAQAIFEGGFSEFAKVFSVAKESSYSVFSAVFKGNHSYGNAALAGIAAVSLGAAVLYQYGALTGNKTLATVGYYALNTTAFIMVGAYAASMTMMARLSYQAGAIDDAMKFAKTEFSKGSAITAVIFLAITWGPLIYQIASGQLSGVQMEYAIAYAVATTIVFVIFTVLGTFPIVGILIQIIYLIDIILMFFKIPGIQAHMTEAFARFVYQVDTVIENFSESDRLEFDVQDVTFVDESAGFTTANGIVVTAAITSELRYVKIFKDFVWGSAVTPLAKKASLRYYIQESKTDRHGSLTLDQSTGDWESRSGRTLRYRTNRTSRTIMFSELGTGLNRTIPQLYLTEAYALPMLTCWFYVGCDWDHIRGSNHIELGEAMTYDILPSTLDAFVKMDWNARGALAFPQQKDWDGDGLRNRTSGGADPDDAKADSDADGVSDYTEYIKGTNLLLADSDGDGMGDAREIMVSTDPLSRDSDGDGLSDYVEREEGWLVGYTTDAGASALARVWSDPLSSDADDDTITDLNEFAFGLHPAIAEDPSVIEKLIQFDNMHVEEQDSPQVLLHLEERGGARAFADSSGYGNAAACATVANTCPTAGASGHSGSALSFDGGDYLTLDRPVADDFTIAFWMKTTQATGAMTQWYQGKGLVDGEVDGAASDFGVTLGNAGQVMFGVGSTSSPFDITIKGGSVANGAWHHVAATRVKASGAMALYVDGALVASGTGGTASLTAPPMLRLGMVQTGINPYAGALDDVVIYGRALAAAEIAGLMGGQVNPNDLVVLPGAELTYASTISNTHKTRTANGLLTAESEYVDPAVDTPDMVLPFDAEDRITTFSNVARLSGGATCRADRCPSTVWLNGGDRAAIFDGVDDVLSYPRHAVEQRGDGGRISFSLRVDSLPPAGKTAQIFTTDTKTGAISMYLTPAGKLMTRVEGSSSYDYAILNANGTINQQVSYAGQSEHYSTRAFSAGAGWVSVQLDYLIWSSNDPIDNARTELRINGVPDSQIRWQSFPDEVTVGPGLIANNAAGTAPFQGGLNGFSGGWTMNLGFDEDLTYAFDRFNNAANYGDSGAAYVTCARAASCPTYTANGKVGAAVTFDGADDYLPLTQGLSFTDYDTGSISFWVKLSAVPSSGQRAYIVDSSCPTSQRCMDLYFDSQGKLNWDLITNGVASTLKSDYALHFALGEWKQITASWEVGAAGQPSKRTLDVDRVVNTTTGETGSSIPLVFAPNARLGQALAGGSSLSATVDTLKITGVIDNNTRTIYDLNFSAPAYDVAQMNDITEGRGAACPTYGECPTTTAQGYFDEALSFDGVNDRLVASYETTLAEYTISAWVKVDAVKAQSILVLTSGGIQGIQLRLTADGRFQHAVGAGIVGDTVVQPGTWYHVAGVVASDRRGRLYVNGQEEGQAVWSYGVPSGSGSKYEIGAATPGYAAFDGTIDEVIVSSSGTTAAGVKALMAAPFPALKLDTSFSTATIAAGTSVVVGGSIAVDPQASSGTHKVEQEASAAIEMGAITYPVADSNASQLAIYLPFDQAPGATAFDNLGQYTTSPQHPNAVCSGTSCPVAGLRGHVDRAAYFDGLDDRLTLPGSTSTLDFQSIAVWVKADSEGGTILSTHDTLGIQLTTNSFVVRDTELAYELVDNVWTHVVATYNRTSKAMAVYLNGALAASGTAGSTLPSMSWPTIGSRGVGNNVLLGSMDDLRVYMSVLNGTQIQTLYKQSAPAMRFEFDEQTGETVFNDSSANGYVGYPYVETCNTVTIDTLTAEYLPRPNRGFRLRLGSTGQVLAETPAFPPDGTSYPVDVALTLCADDTLRYEYINEDTDGILLEVRPLTRAQSGTFHDSNTPDDGVPRFSVDYTWATPKTTIDPAAGVDGKIGNTAMFGDRGSIQVAGASAVGSLTSGFTVMGWVKPETLSGLQTLLASGTQVSNNGFGFALNGGKLRLDGFGRQVYDSTVAVKADSWQHVAVVFDSAYAATFYLDGASKQKVTGTAPLIANDDDPLSIGASVGAAGARSNFFVGELDELAVYPRALSAPELYSVYLRELRWFSDRASSYVKVDAASPTIELLSDYPYRPNEYTQLVAQTSDDSYVQLVELGLKGPGMADFVWAQAPVCDEAADSGQLWCPAFDPTTLGGQGAYQIKLRAVDAVGRETISAVTTLYVDATGPVASSSYAGGRQDLTPEQGEELAWSIALSGALGDPAIGAVAGSGVYTPTVTVALYDGKSDLAGTGEAQAASVDGGTWSVSYRFAGLQPSGSYTIKVFAEDVMRNGSTTTVGTILLDERPASMEVELSELADQQLITETTTLAGVLSEQANWSGELLKYHFEEPAPATSFDDGGSLEFDATCSACPSSAGGRFGRALSFDGVDDALSIPPTTTVELAKASFTLAAWLQTTGTSRAIITRSDGDGSWELGEKSFYLDSAGRPTFVGWGNNYIRSTQAVNDGGWHHVAVSWDYAGGTSGTGTIYLDGRDVTNRATTNYAANNADKVGDGLFIGLSNRAAAEAPNNLAGLLDETTLYDRALSEEEVYALAQANLSGVARAQIWLEPVEASSPISDSLVALSFEEPAGATVFANEAGNTQAAWCASCPVTAAGLFGQALSFDGVDDALTLTAGLTLTRFTQSAWVYPTSGDGAQHGIFGAHAEDWVSSAPSLSLFEGGRVQASFGDGGSWNTLHTPTAVVPSNAWSHIAATYDGTTYSIYVNGSLAANTGDLAGRTPAQVSALRIGAVNTFFPGRLDEVRLYDRALSAAEVALLASSDNASGWQDAALGGAGGGAGLLGTQSGASLADTWSYQLPADAEGFYEIHTRASDAAGNVGGENTVWRGSIDLVAPRLTASAGFYGSGASAETEYRWSVRDRFIDAASLEQPCPAASVVYESRGVANGTDGAGAVCRLPGHVPDTVTFKVCDAAGRCASHTITPSTAADPANVIIQSPAEGSTPASGGEVVVAGIAYDPDGLREVHLYANDAYIGSVGYPGAPSEGSWSIGWTPQENGIYTLKVVLVDQGYQQATDTLALTVGQGYPLHVSREGLGSGTITSQPAGISCGPTCNKYFGQGELVTLTATPATGSTFESWGGACSGSGSCVVTMDQERSVTARFAVNRYALTVTKSGSGSGTISSAPAGINSCSATCSASFDHGTNVKLTVSPAATSTFSGWGGACSGTSTTCTVSMVQARSVTASFALRQYALTIERVGGGTVASQPAGISCGDTCQASFGHGTNVTLSATPATGWSFAGWEGACGGTGTCSVAMTQGRTVRATFTINQHELSVTRDGTGQGSISSDVAGIYCGDDCAETYNYGTVVVLTASPADGSTFTGWSEPCSGTDPCAVTVDQARSVTASFAINRYTLSVVPMGSGSGSITSYPSGISCGGSENLCQADFDHGTVVVLTASAAEGMLFTGWSEPCSGTDVCEVTINQARSVSASFEPQTLHRLRVLVTPGYGIVNVSGAQGIFNCEADCAYDASAGTVMTLSPGAHPWSSFLAWGGDCSGNGPLCSVTMDQPRYVTASFVVQRVYVPLVGLN